MGVDIQTYRCRIGTVCHGIGSGTSTSEHVVDFTQFTKSIGTLLFIGTLLLIAGIEPNPGPRTGDQPVDDHLRNILQKLNLEEKYPGKIKMSDILSLRIESGSQSDSQADIPWKLIQSIILFDSDCRDRIVADIPEGDDESDDDSNDSFEDTVEDIYSIISPLDILHVVIQCCDPLVQGFLYKNLYLCKIAVPFMFWQINPQNKVTSLWPLKSVVLAQNGSEFSAIQLPTYTVAFARFGRPHFSKSKFLNTFLTKNAFEVFFNKDCPRGNVRRFISNDSVETFWSQSENEAVTIFNLRGDISKQNKPVDICFLSELTDILTIFIELENIGLFNDELPSMLKHFNRIALIVNNPTNKGLEKQRDVLKDIRQSKYNIKTIVTCRKTGSEISPSNLTQKLRDILSNWYEDKDMRMQSVEQRMSNDSSMHDIKYVNCDRIVRVKTHAECFITNLKGESDNDKRRQIFIGESVDFSKRIAYKKRETYTSSSGESIKAEIKDLLNKQVHQAHPIMWKFAKKLVAFESVGDLQLFLAWVSEFLETERRNILPRLKENNKQEFEKLCSLQDKNPGRQSEEIKAQTKRFNDSSKAIDAAVFSITHLFSELNHILEACVQNKIPNDVTGLPTTDRLLDAFADLMIQGQPLELLNGESMYLPVAWIGNVFHRVHEKIAPDKIFALSILGLQSSGKSTLLNTMFGSQFSVSAGRCTRGVHIQLLSVSDMGLPFRYLLLIDTEGLRAPELGNEYVNHDNELATFVAGMGDTTILNIMGENMSEISDILQIMIHAFLRLKLANNRIDIRKSCMFVYHNVSDRSATWKMHQGLQQVMLTLDEMTQEAASSEDISDIFRFSQVIDFNIKTNVWYFPNLWQGNQPFASVNKRYSERARDLQQHILKQAVNATDKSYKTLDNIFIQINDLWQGVLKESFVFSFRNSLEIKAYCFLQKEFKDIIWQKERILVESLQQHTNLFSKCCTIPELKSQFSTVNKVVHEQHIKRGSEVRELVLGLFEQDLKEIMAKWKKQTLFDLDRQWKDLLSRCKDEIDNLYRNRDAELKMDSLLTNNEHKLYDASKDVAKRIRQTGKNSHPEILKEFETLWQDFIRDISTENQTPNLSRIFFENLLMFTTKDSEKFKQFEKDENIQESVNRFKTLKEFARDFEVKETDFSPVRSITHTLTSTIDRKSVVQLILELYSSLDQEIENRCSVNTKISEHHVKEFLRTVEQWMGDVKRRRDAIGLILTPTGQAKICVYACRFAVSRFEEHNRRYEQKSGIQARLLHKQSEAKARFFAMVYLRRAEETFVLSFSNVIATAVKEYISTQMTTTAVKMLFGKIIPTTKYQLMIDLVTDLVNHGRYEDWSEYLSSPDTYAKGWIKKQGNTHLFGANGEYAKQAIEDTESMFRHITENICKYLVDGTEQTDKWIDTFVNETNLPMTLDKFNDIKRDFQEIKSLEQVADLKNHLFNKIKQYEVKIKEELQTVKENNILWHESNPFEEVFYRVWGCNKKCPFCRESCAREKAHDGFNHYCIQHRIEGCIGIYNETGSKISVKSCSYSVHSGERHRCIVFDYACNNGESKCEKEGHNYKDYKQHCPEWDIAPNGNIDETSKVWMWFMATFQKELKTKFTKVTDIGIPVRWHSITREEAIASYRAFWIPLPN